MRSKRVVYSISTEQRVTSRNVGGAMPSYTEDFEDVAS
jgi:hypothetical protein